MRLLVLCTSLAALARASNRQFLPALGPVLKNTHTHTELHLIEGKDLHGHPLENQLREVINEAYFDMQRKHVGATFERLQMTQEHPMAHEIGSEGFTLVLTQPGRRTRNSQRTQSNRVVSTVSAQPLKIQCQGTPAKVSAKELENIPPMMRSPDRPADPRIPRSPEEGGGYHDAWETKLLCTRPDMLEKGLGSWLLKTMEAEIRRRWETAPGAGSERKTRRLRLFLEINKKATACFYERRGYAEIYSSSVSGNKEGRPFTITKAGMVKDYPPELSGGKRRSGSTQAEGNQDEPASKTTKSSMDTDA